MDNSEKHNTIESLQERTLIVAKHVVKLKDIIYIYNQKNDVFYYTKSFGKLRERKTLKTVMSELPDEVFFRINRSHIINFSYVATYVNNDVTLSENILLENATIARAKRKYFKQKIKCFLK